MVKRWVILFIILMSCQSTIDVFYKQSHVEDIDVLPLIKPYRLFTPNPGSEIWHLDFEKANEDKYGPISQTNVCRINVTKGIIFGHCIVEKASPNSYFVIVPRDSIEIIFEAKEDWEQYLDKNGINSNELYEVLTIYTKFQDNYRNLPWLKEVEELN